MFRYIIRRLLYTFPIIIGIALVTFLLFNVVGGDPALMMVGRHSTAEHIAEVRAEYGYDQPLPIQFAKFLKQIATLDFGKSHATRQDIMEMIVRAAPVSFLVAAPALFLSILISIALSLLVAFYRGTWLDRVVVVSGVTMISVPSLSYILFGQYFLAFKWGYFPISGFSFDFPDVLSYLAMPVLILMALTIGAEVRFYRTVMLDEVNQDYIRTARSKGLPERVVMFKHVLKNAMIPIITNVVIEIPFLIVGSLLIENFFSIPGMASQLVDALSNADLPVIKAQVIILSLLYVMFNLISDILYSLVDPRVVLK